MSSDSPNPFDLTPITVLSDERLNDQPKPLDPNRFKWRKTRYQRHQNGREQMRRLRQISRGQLQGGVSSEAQEMAQLIALNIAVSHAELACSEYVRDAEMYENEHTEGRMALLSAVSELARFLRGEPAYASATTSALLRTVDTATSGNGDNDLAVA